MQGKISDLKNTTLKYVGTNYVEIAEGERSNETLYSYTNNSGKKQVVFFTASFQAPATSNGRYDIYLTKEGQSSTTYSRSTFPNGQEYPCINTSTPVEIAPREAIWCKFWGSASLNFYGNIVYTVFQSNV